MSWRKGTLVILSGQTESEELDLQANGARRIKNITFISPNLGAEVVQVHLADAVGGTYKPQNDGFGNITTLQDDSSQTLVGITAGALKLVATGAVGADRTFIVSGAAQK